MRSSLPVVTFLALALVVPVVPSHATLVVPDAQYTIGWGFPGAPPVIGPVDTPMSDSRDFRISAGNRAVELTAVANAHGGKAPGADVQGSLRCLNCSSFVSFSVSVDITYFFAVDGPPNVPLAQVPVIIRVLGHTSASGDVGASADATVSMGGLGQIGRAHAQTGAPDGIPDDFDESFVFPLFPGSLLSLVFHAEGRISGALTSTGQFQAIADPLPEIDPTFPDRDLYSIRFSRGIGPAPPAVPAPPALVSCLAGIVALAALRQRRTRSSRT